MKGNPDPGKNKWGSLVFFGVIVLIGLGFVASVADAWVKGGKWKPGTAVENPSPTGEVFPVNISRTAAEPLVETGQVDAAGNPVKIGCATCHDNREPNLLNRRGEDLDQFHQGLIYAHGEQSCLTCHNPEDYDSLQLADGQAIPFSSSMKLCAQCHSDQHEDYENGSHGGMTGYWDLTRGGRARNTCIDCHDPHRPAYPKVMPVFPPLPIVGEKVGGEHHEVKQENSE